MKLLILLVTLALAKKADSAYLIIHEEEDVFCYHGLAQFEPGWVRNDGCSSCACGYDGEWDCTETPCCLYLTLDGQTERAHDGDHFNDGCNACRCVVDTDTGVSVHVCTSMHCPDKCFYKKWDGVMGYSNVGGYVHVLHDDSGSEYKCRKMCSCEDSGWGIAQVSCLEDEPCILD